MLTTQLYLMPRLKIKGAITVLGAWIEGYLLFCIWLFDGRRKTTQNTRRIEVDAETKESTRKTEEKLDGRNKEGYERNKPK